MGFAMARFALDHWLAALIAACGGAATVTMNCFQFVFFVVTFSVYMLLCFLVPGIEKTRIRSVFERWSCVSGEVLGAAWSTLSTGKCKEQKRSSCVWKKFLPFLSGLFCDYEGLLRGCSEVPGSHEGLSLPVDHVGSSASDDLCTFGSFNDWEGESLLAGNSPVGIGEQATGRVDVPGEKQIEAAAAAAAASGPPQIGKLEETTNLQVLVRTLLGCTVTLQVPHSPATLPHPSKGWCPGARLLCLLRGRGLEGWHGAAMSCGAADGG